MSAKYKGCIVTFEEGVSEERMDALKSAISCLHGVIDVGPIVENADDHMNRTRARYELVNKMQKVLKDG